MKFVDEVVLEVRAGDGGNGCVAFRREKFQPRGGPSGGDGGDGGDIVVRADSKVSTLLEYRFTPLLKAGRGRHGEGHDRNGRSGDGKEIVVPVGTMVFDDATGEQIADLDAHGQVVIAAKGGQGGFGNLHFKKPWNRAPKEAKEGTPGEQRTLRLELKLLADVGIIGMPNVGKSTLISRLSAAKPKVADYPFTTLVPNLGVVRIDSESTYVLADIPGLVPGAADGAGLGSRFLRHVERTKCLLHLVAIRLGEESDPLEDFEVINDELKAHDPELAARPQVVAMNKADIPETREVHEELRAAFEEMGFELMLISGATGEGLDDVKYRLWNTLESVRKAEEKEESESSATDAD